MAEARKLGDLTVNDGKGLYDNDGLIDSLVKDLNDLLKNMAAGQYIRVSSLTVEMVQKLQSLKSGMKKERESMDDQVQVLQQRLNDMAEQAFHPIEIADPQEQTAE